MYYDLLSQTTLVHSMAVARGLALGRSCSPGRPHRAATSGQLKSRALFRRRLDLLSALAGLLCALFRRGAGGPAAGATARLLRHAVPSAELMSSPACAVLRCTAPGSDGHCLGQHAELAVAARAASLVLFALLLALLSLAGLGVAYLFLWWLVPSALAPRRIAVCRIYAPSFGWLSLAVGAALFIHLAVGLVPAFIGLTVGMNPDLPGDMPIAVILWLLVVLPIRCLVCRVCISMACGSSF